MFTGTQANAYNQTKFYKVAIFCDILRQLINLQVGVYGTFQWSMFADTQANKCIQPNKFYRRTRNY